MRAECREPGFYSRNHFLMLGNLVNLHISLKMGISTQTCRNRTESSNVQESLRGHLHNNESHAWHKGDKVTPPLLLQRSRKAYNVKLKNTDKYLIAVYDKD